MEEEKMKLLDLQMSFSALVPKLINKAIKLGFGVTLGECWRPRETAEIYAKQGKGIKKSLHCDRLAIDLCLFKERKYLTKSEDYRKLGEYWESLGTKNVKTCWGGRFSDGGHFSVEYGGRK
jgi:hypothetical protein